MGFNHFYDDANLSPTFLLSDLANAGSAISEMVLNVTWAQLEPTSGQIDFSAINSAISEVSAYNSSHGTDLGIKLRVWGGVVAPDWVKNLDGPPVATSGKATIDPTNYGSRTFGQGLDCRLQRRLAGAAESARHLRVQRRLGHLRRQSDHPRHLADGRRHGERRALRLAAHVRADQQRARRRQSTSSARW